VATKADIAAVAKDLERLATTQRGEFDVVRRESDVVRGEVDLVRGEVSRLREDMDRRFEQVDRRFEQVDRRFDEMNGRFDETNGRFDETNGRFDEERERVIAVVRESEQRVLATIRGEMVEAMGRQSRLMAFSLVGALTANTGLVLAALRLGT
jgi:chromosome segregation ATPase